MKWLGTATALLLIACPVAILIIAALGASTLDEHPIPAPAPDAGPAPLGSVVVDRSRVLMLDLRGADFEDARGKGCPLEAFVEAPDGGDYPVLRFRCAVYGGP